jgi:hypothetical protein
MVWLLAGGAGGCEERVLERGVAPAPPAPAPLNTSAPDWRESLPEAVVSVALSYSEETVSVLYTSSNLTRRDSPSYLAVMRTAWNHSKPQWSPPFWDCVLHQWIFGYISPTLDGR